MVYQSLYRKYRPQRFGELVGQEHVTTALRNAVRDGRVGHAYLFSGPRGTGKTTTARILAKALNCSNLGADGEPCAECDPCRAIAEGTFVDLFELDAASNRGVADARDLLERIAYRSATGGKKVYILDEVHMLTDAAANTLLKSLEEPPDHVVFVLATTNPEQVLPTIRSRTQHFEFGLLGTEAITAHLVEVCAKEGVDADADALAVIARAGAGSVRDALSLLDRAIAHGTGRVDANEVTRLFGGSPFERIAAILHAVASGDAAGALGELAALCDRGFEPRRIAEDLLRRARDAFLLTVAGNRVRVEAPDEDQAVLAELGEILGIAGLTRTVETLGQAIVDMRGVDAADPRLVLEVALVRLSRRDAGPPLQVLAERVERLERALAERTTEAEPSGSSSPMEERPPGSRSPGRALGAVRRGREAVATPERRDDQPGEARTPDPPGRTDGPSAHARIADLSAPGDAVPRHGSVRATAVELDDVIVAWGSILPDLPVATRTAVQNAQPIRLDGDVVVFGVPGSLIEAARPRFKREADTIRAALSQHLGTTMKFTLVPADDFAAASGGGTPDRPRASTGRDPAASAAQDPAASTGRDPAAGPGRDPAASTGRSHVGEARQARVVRPVPTDRPPDPVDEPPDEVDAMDLAADAPAVSSLGLLEEAFGAVVVDEIPRE